MELVVVLAILATLAGIVGLGFRAPVARDQTAADLLAEARRAAVATGRAVPVMFAIGPDSQPATALPDGSVIGGGPAGMDRTSGRPTDAGR